MRKLNGISYLFYVLFNRPMKLEFFRSYLCCDVLIHPEGSSSVLYFGKSYEIPDSLYSCKVLAFSPSHSEMGTYLSVCIAYEK